MYSVPVSRTVVIGKYRNHGIVYTEYRHKYKALELEVYTENSNGCRRKHNKYLVHGISHNRTYGNHKNRRYAYFKNFYYYP